MKIILNILHYIFFTILVALIALLVSSLFPIDNWYQVKVVLSGSMEPSIHTGSVVVIKPADNYVVGDVITFGRDTRDQVPVTHRIVAEDLSGTQKVFITKGDANGDNDSGSVRRSDIIGKVSFSIPYVGYVLTFAKTKIGFMFLVIGPAVVIMVGEIVNIIKEMRRIRAEKRRRQTKVSAEQIDDTESN